MNEAGREREKTNKEKKGQRRMRKYRVVRSVRNFRMTYRAAAARGDGEEGGG